MVVDVCVCVCVFRDGGGGDGDVLFSWDAVLFSCVFGFVMMNNHHHVESTWLLVETLIL